MEHAIRNEETLWAALEAIAADGGDRTQHTIIFEGWEPTSLYVKGEKYKGTISFTVMEYLCEMQKRIYQAYAVANYGTHDTRKLNAEERRALEIFVSVKDGSSLVDALEKSLTAFLLKLADKLTAKHIIVIALGSVAIIYGTSVWKASLDKQLEIKRMELQDQKDQKEAQIKLEMLAQLKYASDADKRRDELLLRLAETNADFARILQDGQELYRHRLRVASKTELLSTDSVAISGNVAAELLKTHREAPIPVQLNGIYMVAKTNHQVMHGHMMTLTPVDGGLSFNAFLPELFAGGEHAEIIANAYRKRPIGVKVNARMSEGEIISAEISGFYEPEKTNNTQTSSREQ